MPYSARQRPTGSIAPCTLVHRRLGDRPRAMGHECCAVAHFGTLTLATAIILWFEQRGLPGLRQLHMPRCPEQKSDAEPAFQPFNTPGDSRTGQSQRPCRAAEAAAIGNLNENAHIRRVYHDLMVLASPGLLLYGQQHCFTGLEQRHLHDPCPGSPDSYAPGRGGQCRPSPSVQASASMFMPRSFPLPRILVRQ